MGYCKWVTKYHEHFYLVFRILVGLLFLMHGAQKLFGWFGGSPVPLIGLFGLAGLIEFIGGLAIVLGFFTRLVAPIAGVEMLVAFFMVHFPSSWNPLLNKGELALLYLAAFLVMTVHGNGKWNLEKSLLGKEVF